MEWILSELDETAGQPGMLFSPERIPYRPTSYAGEGGLRVDAVIQSGAAKIRRRFCSRRTAAL